jgi:hypothetical protein
MNLHIGIADYSRKRSAKLDSTTKTNLTSKLAVTLLVITFAATLLSQFGAQPVGDDHLVSAPQVESSQEALDAVEVSEPSISTESRGGLVLPK